MNRRISREVAMKLLFEMSINKGSREEILESFKENTEIELAQLDMEYIMRLLKGVEEHEGEINANIEKHLINWKLYRVSKINIAILRICTYEILFDKEIPDKVSVNEGIEMAKKYSEDNAGAFINGVLAKMINQVE